MTRVIDHFSQELGQHRRQTAGILVDKLLEGDYVGLELDDISMSETIDWGRANTSFRDLEKKDRGNPGTDWMDALKEKTPIRIVFS
jgi:hypothetical protein